MLRFSPIITNNTYTVHTVQILHFTTADKVYLARTIAGDSKCTVSGIVHQKDSRGQSQ